MLPRRGVLCKIIQGRVSFQCELCCEDITDLTREEKEEHLHIRHRDADWRREKHTVTEIFTHTVSKGEKHTVEEIFTTTVSKDEEHTVEEIFTDTVSNEEKNTVTGIVTDTISKGEENRAKHAVEEKFTDTVSKRYENMHDWRESQIQDFELMDTIEEIEKFRNSTTIGFKKETNNITSIRPGFPCDNCSQILQTKKALQRHRNTVHKKCKPNTKKGKQFIRERSNVYPMVILRKLMKENVSIEQRVDSKAENKDSFVCSECGKQFTFRSILERHILMHNDQRPFPCMQCGKKLKSDMSLQRHMKGHLRIFDYKCEDCEASYTAASSLMNHRMAKHSGGHVYKCPECGKGFNYRTAFDNHKRLHTGEKKYQCHYCDKRFRLYARRSKHERVHRGIKEYQCTRCSKMFMQEETLRIHIKRHLNQRDHVCRDCGKAFFEPADVRRHKCSGKTDHY